MKIRRAELSDFEVYKTLFVEDEAECYTDHRKVI